MRSLIVLVLFVAFFIGFLPVLLLLLLLKQFAPKRASLAAFYIIRAFMSLELIVSGTKIKKDGLENVPDEPVLFVGNHRSYYDVLCTYTCMRRPVGYVGKIEIKKIPVMAQWMELIDCVFIDRHNIKEGLRAIIKAIDKVKSGTSIFIFPEGTRNRSENMDIPGEFKEGSLKIAEKAGCLIVPVAIKNTESCYEAHRPFVKGAEVSVSFLKPYSFTEIPEEYKKKPAAYTRMLIEERLKGL